MCRNIKSWFITTVLVGFLMTVSVSYGAQTPVYLGTADDYVILAKTGITTVPKSKIVGNMGVSPVAASAITGFAPLLDATGTFSVSSQVEGKIYAANYFKPTPLMLTMAVHDMQIAYINAAGRGAPDFEEFWAGQIAGKILAPGLYKWSTGVVLSGNVVLVGGPDDVWIFQCAGVLSSSAGSKVTLTGGAQSKNIFWQAVSCIMGASSHLEGIVLSATTITMGDSASIKGRLLSQTAVTLIHNTIVQPKP